MAFVAAENENRYLQDLPQADFDFCVTLGKLLVDVITYQKKKLFRFSVSILYPLCSLQSAVFILYLIYILYPVCSLQSSFCT